MSDWFDAFNGSLELVAAALTSMHVEKTWYAKSATGVSIPAQCAFAGWGLWNCLYYPHLGQWLSFIGGLAVFGMNALWATLLIRYRTR
jgi:hypothetical protein